MMKPIERPWYFTKAFIDIGFSRTGFSTQIEDSCLFFFMRTILQLFKKNEKNYLVKIPAPIIKTEDFGCRADNKNQPL